MRRILLYIAVTALIMGCTTHAFQPVAKQIQGEWLIQPITDNYEEIWRFENGSLTIFINGDQISFKNNNGTTSDVLEYTVDNTLSSHFVHLQSKVADNGPKNLVPDQKKWLVIKINNEELYISSESHDGRKGEYQLHFIKN